MDVNFTYKSVLDREINSALNKSTDKKRIQKLLYVCRNNINCIIYACI